MLASPAPGAWVRLLVLSLLPALAWTAGTALFPPDPRGLVKLPSGAALAAGTYLACVFSVLLLAGMVMLAARLSGAATGPGLAFAVSVDVATPVLLAGVALIYPPLILVPMLAACHGLVLLRLGLEHPVGIAAAAAAGSAALVATGFVIASGIAGAIASALGWW